MCSLSEVTCSAASFLVIALSFEENSAKRKWWIRKIFERRWQYSGSDLLNDLKIDDLSGFRNFARISSSDFEFLVNKIGPKIKRKNTNWRNAVSVHERLAIALRFFATGDSYHFLMYLFKVSKQLISKIVLEVAEALISSLQPYMPVPTTSEAWEKIAEEFNNRWNFPHCIGALDGKHVIIQAPIKSGSEYFNYKGGFSIVLMALVDATYKFIYVNVGCKGGHSDGSVVKTTDLWQALERNMLNLPQEKPLSGRTMKVPYVIVADAAFPLQDNVMKPYPGQSEKGSIKRVFNYRLSRARRISENAFGILSAVFRVLRRPMLLEPKTATSVTLACIYLHNFLRSSNSSNSKYTPPGSFDIEDLKSGEIIPGSWRNGSSSSSTFTNLEQIPRRGKGRSNAIRDEFANFFVSPQGKVPWQDKYL